MDRLAAGDAALPEAQYAAAMLWQRAEHGAKALAAAERALALRPDWPQAEFARVRALTTRRPPRRGARPLGEARRDRRPVHAALPRLAAARRGAARRSGRACSRRSGAPATPLRPTRRSALASIAIDEGRFDDAERLVDDAARDPEQAARRALAARAHRGGARRRGGRRAPVPGRSIPARGRSARSCARHACCGSRARPRWPRC